MAMAFLLGGLALPMAAQLVFIPDTEMRAWLNGRVPGVVDVNGYMDTAFPGIANCTSASLVILPWGPTDLTGLQYLTALISFELFSSLTDVGIPNWPPNLITLQLNGYEGVQMPQLPNTLLYLSISFANALNVIPPLPDGFKNLNLRNMAVLSQLPNLPDATTQLILENLPSLTSLPPLPQQLVYMTLDQLPTVQQLPVLPPLLETLSIRTVPLTSLPALPTSLTQLICSGINVTELPEFPAGLSTISLSFSELLATLPELPQGLTSLGLNGLASLTTIPALPEGMYGLTLANLPALPSWPILPASLVGLGIGHLPLIGFPTLPTTISELGVFSIPGMIWLPPLPDQLTRIGISQMPDLVELPVALPNTLEELSVSFCNQLTHLPALPEGLIELDIEECEVLACLPPIPEGLMLLSIIGGPISCLPNDLGPVTAPAFDFDPSVICAEPCPYPTGVVGGILHQDVDHNGLTGATDPLMPGGIITMEPGGDMVSTNAIGVYRHNMAPGSYTLTARANCNYPQSTFPIERTLDVDAGVFVDTTQHFLVDLEAGHTDLAVHLYAWPARPGFSNALRVFVSNVGSETVAGTVSIEHASGQELTSTSTTPTSVVGNTVNWDLPGIAPGGNWSATLNLTTEVTTLLGTLLTHTANVVPSGTDEGTTNNNYTLEQVVVGSFDPNAIVLTPDRSTVAEVISGLEVEHTIHFQNTGTYPAERVLLVDTVNVEWDLATFHPLASSHAHAWSIQDGILHVLFEGIDLPDSTSDVLGSQGYFTFGIQPMTQVVLGDEWPNQASIFFDYNTPVATGSVPFIIDGTSGLERATVSNEHLIRPVPATSSIRVSTCAGGADPIQFRVLNAQGSSVLGPNWIQPGAEVDISSLAPGVYIADIKEKSGTDCRTYIIKQ